MTGDANVSDDAMLRRYGDALADGIEAALPGWVERSVSAVMVAWIGAVPDSVARDAVSAGCRAAEQTTARVRALLATDVDRQGMAPLTLIRDAVRWPTAVLAAAGAPPVERDPFAERTFPDDLYDLAPASFADLDPALQDAGVAWGAAKAHTVMARRRAEGRR